MKNKLKILNSSETKDINNKPNQENRNQTKFRLRKIPKIPKIPRIWGIWNLEIYSTIVKFQKRDKYKISLDMKKKVIK